MTLFSFFISFVCIVSASIVSARPSAREACGEGGVVLNTTMILHEGKEFTLTSKSCPNFVASNATVSKPADDIVFCDSWSCSIVCLDLGAQPLLVDCHIIESMLNAEPAGTYFTAAPGTISSISYNSCAYAFANGDTVTYNPCYAFLSQTGDLVSSVCFGAYPTGTYTAGGACLRDDSNWYLEAYHP
ncbi:hypothetical protein EWM64_g889 [Hericium alpestre]|uniref:Cyanovirin-N domain-containing protein n=1 Tax=Hericium alpestre TaxID=135208 RepID=A0A4Z0A9W3_9AGAM|nr:hypothetical protein EWM64_g889 [Hericium alpestre]